MGQDTAIAWTDHTFNPWWGCTKVSAGCANCYAEKFDKRVGGDHWGPGQPRRTFTDKHWNEPLKWNAAAERDGVRRRVFCASMADVFDAEAPEGALTRLWDLIRATPSLDWLLLTKRPERIAGSLPVGWGCGYPNVWLGTSVEDQKAAETRIPALLQVPAAVRFLSCEPLLDAVDLVPFMVHGRDHTDEAYSVLDGIDWVICGGESGPGARPMQPAWVLYLHEQVHDAGAAWFWKQTGSVWAKALWLRNGKGEDVDELRRVLGDHAWLAQDFPGGHAQV